MLDFGRQKKALQARLRYYDEVFPQRSKEYRAFKNKYSIPRIHLALKLLEHSEYGSCQECSEYIGDQRLMLVPGALFCVSCQQEKEGKAKRAQS